MGYKNYLKDIEEALAEIETLQTKEEIFIQIKKISLTISMYLRTFNSFYKRVSQEVNKLKQTFTKDEEFKEISYYTYSKINLAKNAEILLSQGYQIIDLIREYFTSQHIKYKVGIEYYGELYETELSIQQIIDLSYADLNTKASDISNLFKLRMGGGGKGKLIEKYNMQKTSNPKLYEAAKGFAFNKYPTINRGNFYEAYEIYSSTKSKFYAQLFENELLKAIKNNVSFVKGGDFQDEQIKGYFKNAPSIATTLTIRKTLEEFNNILKIIQSSSLETVKEKLKNLFLSKENILDKAIDNIIEQKLEQLLNL